MKNLALVIASILIAGAAMAATNPIFTSYEGARQALLKASVPEVQKAAKQIGTAARGSNQQAIAEKAAALEKAADLAAARTAFAALSNEMIKYRASVSGDKPVVAYCAMEKKSWLQPKGTISNPYVAASMKSCGEVKAD